MSLNVWDPFQGTSDTMGNVPTLDLDRESSRFIAPKIDWEETPDAHIIRADLPGLKKAEVKVEVEDGHVIKLSGERKLEEEKKGTWHRAERGLGKFLRRFRLPGNTKMDEVQASLENGVLTVVVPKVEERKPVIKSIEIIG